MTENQIGILEERLLQGRLMRIMQGSLMHELTEKIATLEKELVDALTDDAALVRREYDNKINTLANRVADLEKRQSHRESEFETSIAEITCKIEALQSRQADQEQKASQLSDSLVQVKADCDLLYHELENHVREKQSLLNEVVDKTKDSSNRYDESMTMLRSQAQQLTDVKVMLRRLEKTAHDHIVSIAKDKTKLAEPKQQIEPEAKLVKRVTELETRVEKCTKHGNQHDLDMQRVDHKINQCVFAHSDLECRLNDSDTEIVGHWEQLEAHKKQIAEHETRMVWCEAQFGESRIELDDHSGKMVEYDGRLNRHRTQLNAQRANIEEHKLRLDETQSLLNQGLSDQTVCKEQQESQKANINEQILLLNKQEVKVSSHGVKLAQLERQIMVLNKSLAGLANR